MSLEFSTAFCSSTYNLILGIKLVALMFGKFEHLERTHGCTHLQDEIIVTAETINVPFYKVIGATKVRSPEMSRI